jgi:hypothetical protein
MKTKRVGRRKQRLSNTLKQISTVDAILHLFGNSIYHLFDALLSADRTKKLQLEEFSEKLEPHEKKRFERLWKKIKGYEDQLRPLLEEGLQSVGYGKLVPESLRELVPVDLEKGGERYFGSGLVFNLGFVGSNGKRDWEILGEADWESHLLDEMKIRADYRTKDGHEGRATTPPLFCLYSRLPPWLAKVVGSTLETQRDIGKIKLIGIITEFAKAFSDEVGVDVIGIAVHRENDADLHVHLVFSETREITQPIKRSGRELKAQVKQIAEERIAHRKADGKTGSSVGRNSVMQEVRKELEAVTKAETVTIRNKRSRSWRTLGPSFRGKKALWEMSGRNADLAAMNDRLPEHSRSFRAVVVDPVIKGEDLGKTFLDYWAEQWLSEQFKMMLTKEQTQKVELLGNQSVERYLKWGTEHPSVEDYIFREIQKVEKEIANDIPAIRQENIQLRKQLLDLQEARDALDHAPAIIKRSTYAATIRAAVNKAEFLEEIKQAAFDFFKRFPKVIEDIRKSLKGRDDGTEALPAWEKLWELLRKLMHTSKEKTKRTLAQNHDMEKMLGPIVAK